VGSFQSNALLTDSRDSRMIVNTPRIVPNGINKHSQHATVAYVFRHYFVLKKFDPFA